MLSDARLLIDTLRFWPKPNADVLAERWSQADSPAIVRLAEQEGAALWLQRRARSLGVTIPAPAAALLSLAARPPVAPRQTAPSPIFRAARDLFRATPNCCGTRCRIRKRISKGPDGPCVCAVGSMWQRCSPPTRGLTGIASPHVSTHRSAPIPRSRA